MNTVVEYLFGKTNLAPTERIITDHTKIRTRILGIYIDHNDKHPKFFDGTPADYAVYSAFSANISYSFPSSCIALVEIGMSANYIRIKKKKNSFFCVSKIFP